MPLDQDDLLIFSVRRKEKPGETAKPAEEKPREPEQQPQPTQKPQVQAQPTQTQQPVQVYQAQPQQPAQQAEPQEPQPKLQPQPPPEIKIPRVEPKPPEVLLKTTFAPTRPFQRSKPAAPQQQQAKKPAETQKAPAVELPRVMPNAMNPATYSQVDEAIRIATGISRSEFGGATVKETKAGARSRMAADGLQCTWHPWRSAYAVCEQCHRPFCFEDITASGGDYYCLEDIDKAAAVPMVQGGSAPFDVFSAGGAALLIAAFFVYMYFANAPLTMMFGYIYKVLNSPNPAALISPSTYGYLPTIGGLALTIICVISGFFVMVKAHKGFMLGIGSSLLAVIIFMLQFLATGPVINAGTAYLLAVSIMLGAGAVMLAKSMTGAPRQTMTRAEAAPEQIAWPNTGRF